jgi:hypothetical protein
MITSVSEYLSPEFLYFAAIKRQSILIYPFEYPKHLEPLLELLREWYIVENIDGAILNNPENIEVFLAQSNDLLPEEKPSIFMIENITEELISLFAKYPLSQFLGISKEIKMSLAGGTVISYNKKRNSFDPPSIARIEQISPDDSLFKWCKDLNEIAINQSLVEAKSRMQEIRETAKELFELVTEFSVGGYAALMNPFSDPAQKTIIRLCELWFQVKIQEMIPSEAELLEYSESQKAFQDDVATSDDIEIDTDMDLVLISAQDTPNGGKDGDDSENPYLFELITIEGNKDIDLAFAQAIRQVVLPPSDKNIYTKHEEKYTALRKTIWKDGIPRKFFEDLLLIHMREVVKVKRTSPDQFSTVLFEEFTQITSIFGNLCPNGFDDFVLLPVKYFSNDAYIKKDLVTGPEQSLPFNAKNGNRSQSKFQSFDNFGTSEEKIENSVKIGAETNQNVPAQDVQINEPSFEVLWTEKLSQYISEFSIFDPRIISKLKAETIRLGKVLQKQ